VRLSSVLGVVNGRQLLIAVLGVKLPCNRKKIDPQFSPNYIRPLECGCDRGSRFSVG